MFNDGRSVSATLRKWLRRAVYYLHKPLELATLFKAFILVSLAIITYRLLGFNRVISLLGLEADQQGNNHDALQVLIAFKNQRETVYDKVARLLRLRRPCMFASLAAIASQRLEGRQVKLCLGVVRGKNELTGAHAWVIDQKGKLLAGKTDQGHAYVVAASFANGEFIDRQASRANL